MIYWGDLPKACHCLKQAKSGLDTDMFWHSLRTQKLKATTDCLSSLTSEMPKASPSDTATRSSRHYFAHIVKVKFVLTHLLSVLTKHACQHKSFWGSRCDSSHAPTISLKPVLFTGVWLKFSEGGQGCWHLQNPLPPTNSFCLYPPPILRCFWKGPLMIPHTQPPHFKHLSLLTPSPSTTPSPP